MRLHLSIVSFLLLGLVGCGGATSRTTPLTAADHRARAAAQPTDPGLALARAEAELFADGGDSTSAAAALARARELGASPLRVQMLAAIEADLHGRHREALAGYLAALRAAAGSEDAWAGPIAEVAVASIVEYDDALPGYAATVRPVFEELYAGSRVGPRARWAIGNVLIDFAYRRGDIDAVRALAGSQRCVTSMRIAGPFGPRQLLDFDRALAPEEPGPLAESYDLGVGRGRRATREAEARGCAVHLGNGPVGGPGTTYAEGTFEVPSAGLYTIRLETPNAVELFVDDRSVARIDRRVEPVGRTTLHALELTAGPHRVLAKVTTRHPNPIVLVSLFDGDQSRELDLGSAETREAHPLAHYLDVTRAMARADWVGARERLGAIDADTAPALPLVLATGIAFGDPLRAETVSRDDALRFVTEARERDPEAWYPRLQAARFEADNGRVREAIAMLREGMDRHPEVLAFALTLVDLLTARGWNDQVEPVLATMRTRVPDACRPVRAALNRALERGRVPESDRLVEQLVSCDARSDARLQRLFRRRDWDAAGTELARLAALEPRTSRFAILDSELTIARARNDQARIEALLGELGRMMPQSQNIVLAEIDRLVAHGEEQAARTRLLAAFTAEPTAMVDLRRLARSVFHESPLESYRRDGLQVIRDFIASARTYENAPQVLVWDYTVTRLMPDGTILELTHQIYRAQSEEAVDDLGQFRAPEEALLLTLRTVKADGTRREPDRIAGLEHIEMPSLEVGDFVESEYLRVRPPTAAYDGGAVGDRFFFQSFEIPFDTSQLTLVAPASVEVRVDPRGEAPRTEERTEGDTRVYHWEVHQSLPLSPEPGSVNPREYLPSIGWAVRAEWPQLVESLRDVLADRSIHDPAAARLAREIAGEPGSSVEQRAQRLYHWVLENIEDTSDVFGQAAPMLSARTGSRARIYAYLLGLVGIDADLAVVRSFAFDATESEVPDDDTYGDVAIRVQGSTGPLWVETGMRRSAFGTLSPLVRGQDALILDAPFERARVSSPRDDVDLHDIDVDLTVLPNGDAMATVTETFRGLGAAGWRNELADIPEAQLETLFEQNYVARILPGALMRSLRITGREDFEMPLVFRYEIEVEDIGRLEGGARLLPTLFPSMFTANHARLAQRQRAQIVPSSAMDVRVAIHAPPGGRVEAPEPRALDGREGLEVRYGSSPLADGLVVTRRVRIPRMRVPPAEYPALAALCRAADEQEQRETRVVMP
ncbi:MAG: DUF3857 domain-containing protein [Deltaproteobacteria bacterium]|jgi:hypothetical protein